MDNNWIKDAFFYHIYPLGFCGAPRENDFISKPVPRIEKIYSWIDHIKNLGANAVYLGPVFESTSHGYDTSDYLNVDRRLGTNDVFKNLIRELHNNNIKVVLDGVFNHTGRNFFAFKDVQRNLKDSKYKDWFYCLNFNNTSPYNDHFSYEGWNGHYNLVKLNLENDDVLKYIINAVKMWIDDFKIDGLRLDAADCLDKKFIRLLTEYCKDMKEDFWLMGEVIHGDYRNWAGDEMLDSVTNYECYKGLYSSHVDKNYFEIAYSLNRLFGDDGIYKNLYLYNFADNHDVNRVASQLTNISNIYPLYILLFTMPGIPSVYYGSEFGIKGSKKNNSDLPLRPEINLNTIYKNAPQPDLHNAIKKLAGIRNNSNALKSGYYKQLYLQHEQFAFLREAANESAIIAVNSSGKPAEITINLSSTNCTKYTDLLSGEIFQKENDILKLYLWPDWGRILVNNF